MSVIQSAISSIRKKASDMFNDKQGWFRGGNFTPGKQIQSIGSNVAYQARDIGNRMAEKAWSPTGILGAPINAAQSGINTVSNLPRISLPKPQVQNQIGQTAINMAYGIPESIVNAPRNFTTGAFRVGQELGTARKENRNINYQNILGGVAPLIEGGIDIASMGLLNPAKSLLKEGGKQTIKQALLKGAVKGAGVGALGGATYGLDMAYGKQLNPQELATNIAGGAVIGGVTGGVISGVGAFRTKLKGGYKDLGFDDKTANKLTNQHYIRSENRPITIRQPKAQVEFNAKVNTVLNRPLNTPVFTDDLKKYQNKVLKLPDTEIGMGMSIKPKSQNALEIPQPIKTGVFDQSIPLSKQTTERLQTRLKETISASEDNNIRLELEKRISPIKTGGVEKTLVEGYEVGTPKKYEIKIGSGGKTETVTGEPVKIMDGIDTFVREGNGGWVVSEASTGRYISESRTKGAAIAKADFLLYQNKDKLGDLISKYSIPKIPKTGGEGFKTAEDYARAKNPIPPEGFLSRIHQEEWYKKSLKLQNEFNGIKNLTPEQTKGILEKLPEKITYNGKEYYRGGIGVRKDVNGNLKDITFDLVSGNINQPDVYLKGQELTNFLNDFDNSTNKRITTKINEPINLSQTGIQGKSSIQQTGNRLSKGVIPATSTTGNRLPSTINENLSDIHNQIIPSQISPESVSPQEIKRVADNIIKNNPSTRQIDAEAMAKDVIEGRKFNTKNLSPESKGITTNLPTKPAEPVLPWEEPAYVAKYGGLKTKDSPVLKTGTLKQELTQLETKAPLKSQPIISPELKADIQKGSLAKKVNLLDWFRTPDRVLQKIGLGDEAKQIRTSYNKYLDELPVEISKITKWYDQVKSSPDASKRLFQYLDGQDVPLNKTELKVAGEIQNYLKTWADKLDLPEDKRVTNYITHIFEKDFIKKEFDEDLAKIISEKVPGSVYDPFTQQRLGKTGYVEDVFRSLDAYVKRGVRKFNMDPALERLSKSSDKLPLESWKYVKSFADRVNLRPTQIDTYIDDLVKQSPVGYKLGQRPVTATTRKLRQMVYRGTLGLNVGSALRNLTQGVNTYAKLGEKYTAIGYMRNLKEMATGGDELKASGVLRDDLIQDRQLSAVKGVMEKLDKGLFSFFNLAEKINRGSAYFGAKAKYLNEGLNEKEAIEKAVDLVRKTQFTFGSVDTPVAMQSDIAKTLGQFQSFNLKQAEFLGEMIGGKDIAGMLRWVAGNALMMFTVGNLIGIDLKDIIPFGGVFTGETKLGVTPPIQLGSDIYGAIVNAPDKYGNISEDPMYKRVGSAITKNAPAWIPAGVQAKKTIQGIKAVGEEGSFSKAGRLQYPIEKNTENYVRAGLFGKSNLPAAKEYFNNDGSVLGDKQTEFYKQSQDKQGAYKTFMDERKAKNELEAQKKDFGKTGVQSKQVGDKILYLNENNEVSTFDMAKLDTIAKLPSDNKYNSAIKESKQYSEAAKIMDNTALTVEQQQTALNRLGIDKTKADYYRVANDSDNLKTMFVLDAINKVKTQGGGFSDVIQLLANQRTEINGKQIASNGVLDNLVDEGILTKAQATQLKKYKFENGQLVPKSKTGTKVKKAKKISVTLRKMSAPKLSSSRTKVKRITVPKTYKRLKAKKLKIPVQLAKRK